MGRRCLGGLACDWGGGRRGAVTSTQGDTHTNKNKSRDALGEEHGAGAVVPGLGPLDLGPLAKVATMRTYIVNGVGVRINHTHTYTPTQTHTQTIMPRASMLAAARTRTQSMFPPASPPPRAPTGAGEMEGGRTTTKKQKMQQAGRRLRATLRAFFKGKGGSAAAAAAAAGSVSKPTLSARGAMARFFPAALITLQRPTSRIMSTLGDSGGDGMDASDSGDMSPPGDSGVGTDGGGLSTLEDSNGSGSVGTDGTMPTPKGKGKLRLLPSWLRPRPGRLAALRRAMKM